MNADIENSTEPRRKREDTYVAVLKHVREVSLLGTADLAFWKDRLRPLGLHPAVGDGHAHLMICAIESRFMSIPFREATLSIFLSRSEGGSARDGVYLIRAFNSSRFFTFVERTWFSSPYLHGSLRVETRGPAAIEVVRNGKSVLMAKMSETPERSPSPRVAETWQGPVFLPGKPGDGRTPNKFFRAVLTGPICKAPFSASEDLLTIQPPPDDTALLALVESNFAGREWGLREDATHAKGKTLVNDQVDPAFAF